jgi:hypothetical protein
MKHQKGRWEARLGQSCGNKYQYLGLFATEIDAAVAFDRASIAQRGLEGVTNFGYENYMDLLGASCSVLPAGHTSIRAMSGGPFRTTKPLAWLLCLHGRASVCLVA